MEPLRTMHAEALQLKFRIEDAMKDPRCLIVPAHFRQIVKDLGDLLARVTEKAEAAK